MLLRLLITTGLVAVSLRRCVCAFAPAITSTRSRSVEMSAEALDRRTVFANAAITAAAVVSSPFAAFALNTIPADNEIIKESRTVTGKLDVNNSPVADYMQYPGLYPTIGGKIANNGPYKSVNDVYKVLNKAEKSKLKEYESALVATPATGLDTMRGRDPYRRSFNEYKEVKVE